MPVSSYATAQPEGGALGAAISELIVRLLVATTGRGPDRARTTVDGDLVVVLVEDSLTRGERALVRGEHRAEVLALRRAYQSAMRAECVAGVETLTGRRVLAFMSANHVDPDLAAEIFVLEPAPD
jgi:uncharacterized protein YbcI